MKVNITVVATKTFTAGRFALSNEVDMKPRPQPSASKPTKDSIRQATRRSCDFRGAIAEFRVRQRCHRVRYKCASYGHASTVRLHRESAMRTPCRAKLLRGKTQA